METNKIKETLDGMGSAYGNASVVDNLSKETKMDYAMQAIETFYTELNPNQVTLKNQIIYLNSNQDVNDNSYIFMLQDLYREASGVHSACLDTRIDMTVAGGLIPVSADTQTQEFLDKVNRMGMNWQQIWERLCFDYNLTGMFGLQCLYAKSGEIVEVVHNDISTIRAVAPAEDVDNPFIPKINTWALSTKWADIATKHRLTANQNSKLIFDFNPKTWAEDGGRQLMVHKKYISGMFPYGLPHYQAVMKYIELDNQLAKFHLNKVAGGMFPNVILKLSGNPSAEEKTMFKNEFQRKYMGADKSKILYIWSNEDEASDPKIIPFSTNDDAQIFKDLEAILTQKILTSHRIPPELASIPTTNASLGGDANKMAVSYSFVVENVIKPVQKSMLQSINAIFRHNGLQDVTVNNEGLNLEQDNINEAETN